LLYTLFDIQTVERHVVIDRHSTSTLFFTRQASMLYPISRHLLEWVWGDIEHMMDACRLTEGAHIESLNFHTSINRCAF